MITEAEESLGNKLRQRKISLGKGNEEERLSKGYESIEKDNDERKVKQTKGANGKKRTTKKKSRKD